MVPTDVATAGDVAPDAYGTTGTTVVKIHATAFRSQCSADKLEAIATTGITFRSAGEVLCRLLAPIQLPTGAVITAVVFDGYDVDPTYSPYGGVSWVSQNISDSNADIANFMTDQSGGSYSANATITPHTVNAGNYYFAWVALPKLGSDLRIKGMRITYKLQVSQAPATATFSDVPTNHWAFRYVEALAASGITAGCAPGLFCPTNPITRAEMAVFLADGLGLHYPN